MALLDFLKPKIDNCLGIDIGTNILKIVELKKEKERIKLENYGLAFPLIESNVKDFKTSALSDKELADLIKQVLKDAKIKIRRAIISLPIVSSFSVLIDLPFLSEKELSAAIPFEARKYIPIPIEEVILDWSVIRKTKKKTEGEDKLQVLVVAVPNEIINKYAQVAKLAGLDVLSFEQEAFSLSRVLIGNDPKTYLLVDIGSRGSSVIVVESGFVVESYAIETKDSPSICEAIKKVVDIYKKRYNKNIENCILTGGNAVINDKLLLQDLSVCLTGMEIIIGNPFARVIYPVQLEAGLKKLGPSLAVAVGLAMREL